MEIYIDSAFMERFAEQTSHPLHDELRLFLKKPQTGQKILNFKSQEAFEKAALENPLLEMLLESSVPILNPNFQQEMQEETFYENGDSKLFFNEDGQNDQWEADFGCIFINSQQLHKVHFLFNWHLIPFTKSRPRFNSWSFMVQLKHPCNSLVITDNYLFAKEDLLQNHRQLDENLLSLLAELLPSALKIPFHLTIIGSPIDKRGTYQNYLKSNITKLHNYILEKLAHRFTYPIHLNILIAPFHDRNILTNYAWISSGNSFTYFENRRLHSNTNLTFQPVTQLNSTYNPFYHTSEQTEKSVSVKEVWKSLKSNCSYYQKLNPDESKPYKYRSSNYLNRLLS
ncbi:hypothetical protein [Runella aurantiaca]|uniref:Uncharacterized protein n=1 Tax=Runella aurantiaca TaxID=2282308 RepID=A0A369I6L3_9BACT|nr:hypothetical protein [Runella aurantiaca]RDB04127.1 hypothetical protein DVG78_20310 [Runella aurantiaca]